MRNRPSRGNGSKQADRKLNQQFKEMTRKVLRGNVRNLQSIQFSAISWPSMSEIYNDSGVAITALYPLRQKELLQLTSNRILARKWNVCHRKIANQFLRLLRLKQLHLLVWIGHFRTFFGRSFYDILLQKKMTVNYTLQVNRKWNSYKIRKFDWNRL